MSSPHSDIGRLRQREINTAGLAGKRPAIPVAQSGLAKAAQAAMSPEAWAYIAGGAGRETTMDGNRAAFDRWQIVPRVLRNVEQRDLSVEILGQRFPSPLFLGPVGVLEMAHREADLAVARAAAAMKVPYIFSSQASVPMETCAAAMGDSPRWFQLYWSKSNELVASFVRRAEASGCSAIVLTLDTTMLGWRPRDLDLALLPFLHGQGIAQYTSDPVFQSQLPVGSTVSGGPGAAAQHFSAIFSRPALQWDDLKLLRQYTKLPILLKGVLHPDDARQAVAAGIDGLIVSNHGGRQVDGEIASLDALPAVAEAVNGKVPVLFDSGIRGGADVFKALALGATAACLGRPYVYGLAIAGQHGVEDVIANVLAEFDLTLGLAGCRSVRELNRAVLQRGG